MPGFALRLLPVAMVAGLLLTGGSSGLLAQERVGVNSAVNPEATGALPGAVARRLVIGQDVIFNEHITTTAAGQTQLLFLDESSMTVGPNSDLTIDQFVYDPKSGTGKLAANATSGLLRYVGGKLSKQEDAVTLRSATATLAVRGGAFVAQIEGDGKTDAGFLYGKGLTVCGSAGVGECQTVTRPGWWSVVVPGGLPSRPAPMPPGLLARYAQLLDGRTGGRGGAPVIPTDTSVADSGVSQTISGNLAQSVQQADQNAPQHSLAANLGVPTTVNTVQNTGQRASNVTPPQPPPPPVPAAATRRHHHDRPLCGGVQNQRERRFLRPRSDVQLQQYGVRQRRCEQRYLRGDGRGQRPVVSVGGRDHHIWSDRIKLGRHG